MKQINKDNLYITIVGIVAVLFVFGIRWVYAKVVYHDARCMFAECRIQVNP